MSRRPVALAAVWRRALLRSRQERYALPAPSEKAQKGRQLHISASTIKLLGVTLADYMNQDGEAWPSRKTLAHGGRRDDTSETPKAHASVSERTVMYALDALVDRGWLTVVGERGGRSTVYRCAFPEGVFATVVGLQALREGEQQLLPGEQRTTADGATVAPEVDLEVEKEEVQEDGGLQLEFLERECNVCHALTECVYIGGQWWCADHRAKAA